MTREYRGSLKAEERLDGAVWVLRFKVTRESDHKRVERMRVIGRVQDFPTEAHTDPRVDSCPPSSTRSDNRWTMRLSPRGVTLGTDKSC
jgi:hypothetical protein